MKIRTANEGGVIGILKSDMWGGRGGQVKFTDTIKILRLPSPPLRNSSLFVDLYLHQGSSQQQS